MEPFFAGQVFTKEDKEVQILRSDYDESRDRFIIETKDGRFSEKKFAKMVKGWKNNFFAGHINDATLGLMAFIAGNAEIGKNEGQPQFETIADLIGVLENMGAIVNDHEAFLFGTTIKVENIVSAIYEGWDVVGGDGKKG